MVEAHALRALALAGSLGYRCAAGFLRNRGYRFREAYIILFGRTPHHV